MKFFSLQRKRCDIRLLSSSCCRCCCCCCCSAAAADQQQQQQKCCGPRAPAAAAASVAAAAAAAVTATCPLFIKKSFIIQANEQQQEGHLLQQQQQQQQHYAGVRFTVHTPGGQGLRGQNALECLFCRFPAASSFRQIGGAPKEGRGPPRASRHGGPPSVWTISCCYREEAAADFTA